MELIAAAVMLGLLGGAWIVAAAITSGFDKMRTRRFDVNLPEIIVTHRNSSATK